MLAAYPMCDVLATRWWDSGLSLGEVFGLHVYELSVVRLRTWIWLALGLASRGVWRLQAQ